LDFQPLLGLDFLNLTANRGRNPNLAHASEASFPAESFQADAIAPTVPKFPSALFPKCISQVQST
jgi:hypothetical protein